MSHEKDRAFHEAAKQALDLQAENLTPEIKQSLYKARIAATQTGKGDTKPAFLKTWSLQRSLYPTGIAVAAVLAFVLWLPQEESTPEPEIAATHLNVETLDLLSAEEEFALYEDLEFITWLATQPEQG